MVAHCKLSLRLKPAESWGALERGYRRFIRCATNWRARRRYFADRTDLLQAQVALRESGADILAIYHRIRGRRLCHRRSTWPRIITRHVQRIIVSLCAEPPEVRMWQLDPDSFQELPWRIVEPEMQSFDPLRLQGRLRAY